VSKHLSDIEIIDMIQSGGKAADDALVFLINLHKKSVIMHLRNKRFSHPEDLFQEGIVAIFMQIQNGKFRAQSTIKTYLIAICTKLAYSNFRRDITKEKAINQMEKIDKKIDSPEQLFISAEKNENLNKLLSKLGENCKQILSLWSLQYSMDEIAKMTSYKNANSVKKKKFGCLQKLMRLVEENPFLLK
jgi:RNA polymerase sigma factor (sigma-70 family)